MSDPDRKSTLTTPQDVEAAVADLRQQLQAAAGGTLDRINCDSESVEQGLARLVLSLIELLRRLLERQAVRRLEGGSLSDQQVEEMGQALMKLEAKVVEMAAMFKLKPEDLNLELGPLGRLLDK
jgi:hypothetical protein